MNTSESLDDIAQLYRDIGRRLRNHAGATDALENLSRLAVEIIVPAQDAGITERRDKQFRTVGSTGELATAVDRIQYSLDEGPCVSATEDGPVYRSGDLSLDTRWPRFGPAAAEQTGVLSMLSVQIYDEDDADRGAALNMYSSERDAFTDRDVALAELLASHGSLAVLAAAAQEKSTNLEIALQSNREIGVAIGILMAGYKLRAEEGFDILRLASQHAHRKLIDIAKDVIETGTLELPD